MLVPVVAPANGREHSNMVRCQLGLTLLDRHVDLDAVGAKDLCILHTDIRRIDVRKAQKRSTSFIA